MFNIIFIIINLLCIVVICVVINKHHKSTLKFEKKIKSLESIIVDLTKNLNIQSQKLQLLDDLKINMRQSNNALSSKIVDMNLEMFQELFPKKNL